MKKIKSKLNKHSLHVEKAAEMLAQILIEQIENKNDKDEKQELKNYL